MSPDYSKYGPGYNLLRLLGCAALAVVAAGVVIFILRAIIHD